MTIKRWFPIDYDLADGVKLRKIVSAGNDWQLYGLGHGSRALICKPDLSEKWTKYALLDQVSLVEVLFGVDKYFMIVSGSDQRLEPILDFRAPDSKVDASAFAVSLKETRQIIKNISLHDAIYVERLSRLLPTWTLSEKIDDDEILGRWLTGGVSISTASFRRISSLLNSIGTKELREVIELAGLKTSNSQVDLGLNNREPINVVAEAKSKGELRPKPKNKMEEDKDNIRFRLNGRPFLEEFLNDHVVDIIRNPARYSALGVEFPAAIVLYGPPGCGKTFAVERLVEFLDWPAYHVDANSVGSPYIHETSRKVSKIFEKAMEDAPAVIVIDEMESFLSDRQIHQSTGLHHVEEVAEFLRRIPEAMTKRVLVIGMTNRLEMIDTAILRRGRFDHVIEVGMPSKEEVTELLTVLLNQMPITDGISIETAVSVLEGRPLSDAAFTVREAGRLAAKSGKKSLDQASLDRSINKLPVAAQEKKAEQVGFKLK